MSAPSLPLRRSRASTRSLAIPRPELLVLVVLAGALNLWALSRNGVANEYYAAAVQAMASSWHAFLYGSFDASGVMTVDKPPLALWVQALSVRAFGWSSASLLVPQALMGAATVALTYGLVRRRFGRLAGSLGGLALALTPISVAISRHNNPDALLILCSVAALWFLVRGLEDGRTRWLLLCGLLVGLGFEAKMAAALLVVPGIAAAWLWVAPGARSGAALRGRLRAAGQLCLGGAVMLVVALAWPVLMWLTPASQRPWISGTDDNSIWSLILGYNGLGRLAGQAGGNTGGGGGMGGSSLFGGDPGVLRLLNASLGGQAGWLLGVALVGLVGLVAATRLRRADARTGWLLAVGGAGVLSAVAFSRAAGIFHPYYVSLLAPFVAALAAAAFAVAADGGRIARVAAPAAVVVGAAAEWLVLRNTQTLSWFAPLLVGGALGLAVLLAAGFGRTVRRIAATAAVALLLLAPATWAVQTLGHATSGTFPAGGAATSGMGMGGGGQGGGTRGGAPPSGGGASSGSSTSGTGASSNGSAAGGAASSGTASSSGSSARGAGGAGGGGMFAGDTSSVTEAVAYATEHGGGTVAVASQSTTASVVLEDADADVVGLGGFSGSESAVSISWLADQVESGAIRYVSVSDTASGFSDGRTGASEVLAAAKQVGKAVTGVDGLYDLQGTASALRAL